MKFNFSTGLIFFFALWAAGIIYLVTLCSRQNHDLVSIDYYNRGVAYQTQIDHKTNAEKLSAQVQINYNKSEKNISFQFPKDFESKTIAGNIHFYKPDNAALDFDAKIELNETLSQIVSTEKMKSGLWRTEINFSSNNVSYYDEKDILVN